MLTISRRFSTASSKLVTLTSSPSFPRVAIITLNDPARLNALTEKLGDEWGAIFKSIKLTDFGAVLITGAGRAFSAGGDLDFLRGRAKASPSANSTTMRDFYGLFLNPLRNCALPTIASVSGPAIGAGAALATAADVRIVSSAAKIGFTFPQLGIHCGMGSSFFLPKVVGSNNASRLLLTGEIVNGNEAANMGWGVLVDDSTDIEGGSALKGAMEMASKIAAGAPMAIRGMTRTIRRNGDVGLIAALDREAAEQAACYATTDFIKGVEAVATKTKANWTNWESS